MEKYLLIKLVWRFYVQKMSFKNKINYKLKMKT